jgi:hypothetical protein
MNDKDMNNILYILNRSQEELEIWWHSMDPEDQEYAMWIIKAYREELVRMQETYEELVPLDEEDLSIAKNYLKKFQL